MDLSVNTDLRVLVVDDHRDSADSLALLLRQWGHTPLVAYDGPTALALARDAPPDVALLEVGLRGGMDGYEVARRLRQPPGLGTVLLAAVTCYGRGVDVQRCWDAGIDFHFLKPVDPADLEHFLGRAKDALDRAACGLGHGLR
jgi:CheY-like chemotaxis protein